MWSAHEGIVTPLLAPAHATIARIPLASARPGPAPLPEAPPDARLAAYERHMKFGPARDYWTEFVFEAYFNHDVIFLTGLPDDMPASRL